MSYRLTLLPGDGVGPELTEATLRVLDATGVKIDWDVQIAGEEAVEKFGTPLPDQVLESLRKNRVGLKGPITTPIGSGFRSVNVALRQELDLYASVRPCKTYAGRTSPFENVDIVIVRENTEDLYAGVEFDVGSPEVAANAGVGAGPHPGRRGRVAEAHFRRRALAASSSMRSSTRCATGAAK